jgi:hypothetical protein
LRVGLRSRLCKLAILNAKMGDAKPMPLTPTTPDAICDRDAVSFVMLDGDSFVRVDVHRALLQRMTSRHSDSEHLAAFGAHRSAIERIASAKFDQGEFRSFANSRVVHIVPSDLPH